jgi:hypothetical protein
MCFLGVGSSSPNLARRRLGPDECGHRVLLPTLHHEMSWPTPHIFRNTPVHHYRANAVLCAERLALLTTRRVMWPQHPAVLSASVPFYRLRAVSVPVNSSLSVCCNSPHVFRTTWPSSSVQIVCLRKLLFCVSTAIPRALFTLVTRCC